MSAKPAAPSSRRNGISRHHHRELGGVPSFRHRLGQQLVEPELRARKLKQREVVPGGLLETRRNGTKALQVVKADLNAISTGVALAIEPRLVLSTWIRVNDRLDAELSKLTPNGVRVVAGIGDQGFAARVFRDDVLGDGGLVPLPLRELDVERPPFAVDERVDFRGEPTSRVTKSIGDDPPFPPAASWWARITDASRMTASSSSSSWSALNIAAQWPRNDQLENRL